MDHLNDGGRPAGESRWAARGAGLLVLLAGAASLAACAEPADRMTVRSGESSATESRTGTFFGKQRAMGHGSVRTYVVLDEGVPRELGVAITRDGFRGLPHPGAMGHAHGHVEYLLDLPAQAAELPFTFVEVDWNPAGHEPHEIYAAPHFDFHFYLTSRADRDAIQPGDPQYGRKAGNFPAGEFVPAGYIAANVAMGGVDPALAAAPRMGMHWLHPASPELNGEPFTATFIYGSWDGRLTFLEPMITRAFLESRPDVTIPVPTAERYQSPGYYPAAYRIYWEASRQEYRVALTSFDLKG